MTIVMLVTADKYEPPMIVADSVADSVAELAREIGRTPTDLYSAMSQARKRGGRCKYVRVEVEED